MLSAGRIEAGWLAGWSGQPVARCQGEPGGGWVGSVETTWIWWKQGLVWCTWVLASCWLWWWPSCRVAGPGIQPPMRKDAAQKEVSMQVLQVKLEADLEQAGSSHRELKT